MKFATFVLALLATSISAKSQIVGKEITIDSTKFIAYNNNDTGYSNFVSTTLNSVYRRLDNKASVTLHKAGAVKTILLDNFKDISKLVLDSGYTLITAAENSLNPSFLKLQEKRIDLDAKQIWLNGDWLKIPNRNASLTIENYPDGALAYNTNTKSFVSSNGKSLNPSFWEWFNPKDSTNGEIWHNYTNSWFESITDRIPIIRLRHPINVTNINYPTESEKKDYIIAPYKYGIVHRYSGIMEWDVPEFSVRVGTMATNLDLERNGRKGYGGVLWVGDDKDLGGLRATSRLSEDLTYAEISSEHFSGESHGPFRLRVIEPKDQIQFVRGTRGSKNVIMYVQENEDSVILSAGDNKNLQIQTNGQVRQTINRQGLIGIGESQPKSTLDINGVNGFSQLRLQKKYTPTNSADSNGNEGDLSWDDNYIYIKTSAGWKRMQLESF